jgi:hypothetical protein
VAETFMPQVDVRLDLLPSCVHCGEDVVSVEDDVHLKNPIFFLYMLNKISFTRTQIH